MPSFDWNAFEDVLFEGVITAARGLLAQAADETPFALALTGMYADDVVIEVPYLALGTIETAGDGDGWARMNPADWPYADFEWRVDGEVGEWGDRMNAYAAGQSAVAWDKLYAKFEQALVAALNRARRRLVQMGAISGAVPCFVDDGLGERLIRMSLTDAEVAEHFPWIAEATTSEETIGLLPIPQQVELLAAAAGLTCSDMPSAIGDERAYELLLEIGEPASAAAVSGLGQEETRWRCAMFLADLDHIDENVVGALRANVVGDDDQPGRSWAASALARLGYGRELLEMDGVTPETVVSGVSAPYEAFRDEGRGHRVLDYSLLAEALERDDLAPLLASQLRRGGSPCKLDEAEVPIAIDGLDSPHRLIRVHAVSVLGWAVSGLGRVRVDRGTRAAIKARLQLLAETDPDRDVRFVSALESRPRRT